MASAALLILCSPAIAKMRPMVRYLVLPRRPEGTDGYSEEQLAELVTRDTMIGVVPVLPPQGSAVQ